MTHHLVRIQVKSVWKRDRGQAMWNEPVTDKKMSVRRLSAEAEAFDIISSHEDKEPTYHTNTK